MILVVKSFCRDLVGRFLERTNTGGLFHTTDMASALKEFRTCIAICVEVALSSNCYLGISRVPFVLSRFSLESFVFPSQSVDGRRFGNIKENKWQTLNSQ